MIPHLILLDLVRLLRFLMFYGTVIAACVMLPLWWLIVLK